MPLASRGTLRMLTIDGRAINRIVTAMRGSFRHKQDRHRHKQHRSPVNSTVNTTNSSATAINGRRGSGNGNRPAPQG
eukprot:3511841-Rhodomonas_salina.1